MGAPKAEDPRPAWVAETGVVPWALSHRANSGDRIKAGMCVVECARE
jgi:hypothetical protein